MLFISALGIFMVSAVQGDCNPNMAESTPSSRFLINDDGTVTDLETGLMWSRCSQGQTYGENDCMGSEVLLSWEDALSQNVPPTGVTTKYSDWRLPNVKELASIIEISCSDPSINSIVFPNTSYYVFWTSSPSIYEPYFVWSIAFQIGTVAFFYRNDLGHVRLVRGGI